MPTRKTHKLDNPEQSKRFVDMAREVGVDESHEAFDRSFDKVISTHEPMKVEIKPAVDLLKS